MKMVGAIILVVAAFLTVGGDGAADTFDNTVHAGNTGDGHRYASSSAGAGAGAGAFPQFPPYPMFPQFDYNRLFNDYFRQLHSYHQQLIDYPDKRGSSSVGAAGMFYDKPYRSAMRPSDEFHASADIGSASRQSFGPGTAGATYGYGFGGNGNQEQQQRFPGAAGASAGVSFDGTAYKQHLYPNADTPNVRVENRFADASPPGVQSYGVFVSSAGGAGVGPDGKPYRFKTATSSINDNGNVTVYTVRDP